MSRDLPAYLPLTVRPSGYHPPEELERGDWWILFSVGFCCFAGGMLVGLLI